MATSHSQHRCVFVGNIPYDATEEQLKEICEEVGPVVSFRLVIDRETGKPKGYGFCEYKDEETALSARRNLQGYEINGRQLRVDFAENDKNADRSREQGRGGPGMTTNVDQKQFGGPAALVDTTVHQPIGISVAMAAATIMAQVLGAAQTGAGSNQIGVQPALGSDPLTLHLAKISRNQLNEIMSELKAISTENKEQARQLLLACPHLPKAIFQAQLMLGMVPPQMLQMPNIRQASTLALLPRVQDGVQGQQSAAQNLPGLPPLPQSKGQYNLLSQAQETPVSAGHPSSVLYSQHNALPQSFVQPQMQLSQLAQSKVLHQGQLPLQSGNTTLPSIRPQPQGNFSFRPHIPVTTSSSLKQQVQHPILQHPPQVATPVNVAYSQPQLLRPPVLDQGFQHSSSLSGIPENISRDPRRQIISARINDVLEPATRPSNLVRLTDKNVASAASGQSQAFSTSLDQISKVEEASASVTQLPPDVESALLQQVMNLTPEQLSSLPPDQQQQVIQLQQMLRQAT